METPIETKFDMNEFKSKVYNVIKLEKSKQYLDFIDDIKKFNSEKETSESQQDFAIRKNELNQLLVTHKFFLENKKTRKYEKIKDQIKILEGIKKDDKIYYSNGIMYLQSYTPLQSLYRTISGESRHLTFRYLEIFISDVIEMCNNVKRTIKYIQIPLTATIIKDIPNIKKNIINI